AHPQTLQRLDDFGGNRSDMRVHAFHVEETRGMDVALYAVDDDAERRIHDVEVRIDAERGGEEHFAIARVTVEEIAIVEIAVGARKRDRLRCLMNRKIVRLGEHVTGLPSRPASMAGFVLDCFPARMTARTARVNA